MRQLLLSILVLTLFTGCYKDEVDVSMLNTNPFDRDYSGEPVFVFEETFLQTITVGGNNLLFQIIVFQVREDLFLSPTAYTVEVRDLQNQDPNATVTPVEPGSNRFRYQRSPAPGEEVCLELRLSNNQSAARAEVICATL